MVICLTFIVSYCSDGIHRSRGFLPKCSIYPAIHCGTNCCHGIRLQKEERVSRKRITRLKKSYQRGSFFYLIKYSSMSSLYNDGFAMMKGCFSNKLKGCPFSVPHVAPTSSAITIPPATSQADNRIEK